MLYGCKAWTPTKALTKPLPGCYTVFYLNFSLAGKGPFLTGKAKNMRQRRTLLPGEGLRVYEGFYFRASCQPIDRKVF